MKKFLVLILIFIVSGFIWYKYSLTPANLTNQNSHAVKIEVGSTTNQIADILFEKGLIRSKFVFLLHVKLSGNDGQLQAGKFVLKNSMSVPEMVEILKFGFADELIVTIPEGFSVQEIDDLLASKGVIEGGEIVKCASDCDFETYTFLPSGDGQADRGGKLEGYLFPETYYIEVENFVPKFFIERMLNTFRKKVLETFPNEFPHPTRSLHQLVTMASLIEEEAITEEERPVIAGILWKRFDDGRGLGVDATVRYITDKQTEPITTGDLNVNSPYNTRKFRGLPPGPIASPGIDSIRATLFPEESKYWYYLHDPEGKIHYAVSNEEHNLNRMQYLNK